MRDHLESRWQQPAAFFISLFPFRAGFRPQQHDRRFRNDAAHHKVDLIDGKVVARQFASGREFIGGTLALERSREFGKLMFDFDGDRFHVRILPERSPPGYFVVLTKRHFSMM